MSAGTRPPWCPRLFSVAVGAGPGEAHHRPPLAGLDPACPGASGVDDVLALWSSWTPRKHVSFEALLGPSRGPWCALSDRSREKPAPPAGGTGQAGHRLLCCMRVGPTPRWAAGTRARAPGVSPLMKGSREGASTRRAPARRHAERGHGAASVPPGTFSSERPSPAHVEKRLCWGKEQTLSRGSKGPTRGPQTHPDGEVGRQA